MQIVVVVARAYGNVYSSHTWSICSENSHGKKEYSHKIAVKFTSYSDNVNRAEHTVWLHRAFVIWLFSYCVVIFSTWHLFHKIKSFSQCYWRNIHYNLHWQTAGLFSNLIIFFLRHDLKPQKLMILGKWGGINYASQFFSSIFSS